MSKSIAKAVTTAVNGSKKEPPQPETPPVEQPPPPAPNAIAIAADDPRIPKECTLRVSGQDLQAIYMGLDELPGRIGRMVYGRISAQVQEQIVAALAQPPAPPAPGASKQ